MRNGPYTADPYERTKYWWIVNMSRVVFVICFEHLVFLLMLLIDYFIPDVPDDVDVRIKRERYLARQVQFKSQFDSEGKKKRRKKPKSIVSVSIIDGEQPRRRKHKSRDPEGSQLLPEGSAIPTEIQTSPTPPATPLEQLKIIDNPPAPSPSRSPTGSRTSLKEKKPPTLFKNLKKLLPKHKDDTAGYNKI